MLRGEGWGTQAGDPIALGRAGNRMAMLEAAYNVLGLVAVSGIPSTGHGPALRIRHRVEDSSLTH